MIVNGKEYKLDDLVKGLDANSNFLKDVGGIMLTEKEIDILERNFVDYKSASSLKDLMIKIQYILEDDTIDEDDANELDYVMYNISERNYYENTNK